MTAKDVEELKDLFEQFAIMDTIIPHYPRYVYLNDILDVHKFSGRTGLTKNRAVANKIVDLWKDIKSNIRKNAQS